MFVNYRNLKVGVFEIESMCKVVPVSVANQIPFYAPVESFTVSKDRSNDNFKVQNIHLIPVRSNPNSVFDKFKVCLVKQSKNKQVPNEIVLFRNELKVSN